MTQRWASTREHRQEDINAHAPTVKKLAKDIAGAIRTRLARGISDRERQILNHTETVLGRSFHSRTQLQRDNTTLESMKKELLKLDPDYFGAPQSEFKSHQLEPELL